jgi:serine/threonine protein phosphatase PrpC
MCLTVKQGFQEFLQSDTSGVPSYKSLIQAAHDGYLAADAELIEACRQQAINYSSSTGVSCLITNNVLTVAHIGDSRVIHRLLFNLWLFSRIS